MLSRGSSQRLSSVHRTGWPASQSEADIAAPLSD
jgi:hypothetical protein